MVPESWQWRLPCEFWNISVFAMCTNDLCLRKKTAFHFNICLATILRQKEGLHAHKRYMSVYAY